MTPHSPRQQNEFRRPRAQAAQVAWIGFLLACVLCFTWLAASYFNRVFDLTETMFADEPPQKPAQTPAAANAPEPPATDAPPPRLSTSETPQTP